MSCFPSNECEALALLYIQNQDLTGLTPEEVYAKYQDAYKRIKECKPNKHTSVNREVKGSI